MNLRPSGYEPDELPGCSTPRHQKCSNILLKKPSTICGTAFQTIHNADKFGMLCESGFRRPGSDLLSRALRQSTIGAAEFHGRVRNGIGWDICAITTWSSELANIHIKRRHPNNVVFKICSLKSNYQKR